MTSHRVRRLRGRWRLRIVDWALLAVVIVAVAVTLAMAILDPS